MPDYASLQHIKGVNGFSTTNFIGLASIYWRFENLGLASTDQLDFGMLKTKIAKQCKGLKIVEPEKISMCADET